MENRFDALNIVTPKKYNGHALNMDITIRPLNNGEKVTIRNKKRERFKLPVGSRLVLKDIVIDSSDSILPYGHECLSSQEECCRVQEKDGSIIVENGPGLDPENSIA